MIALITRNAFHRHVHGLQTLHTTMKYRNDTFRGKHAEKEMKQLNIVYKVVNARSARKIVILMLKIKMLKYGQKHVNGSFLPNKR